MIVDRIENATRYRGLGHGIAESLHFLTSTDLAALPDGKHTIDGDKLFAVVQRFQGRPVSDAHWEYHEKYLDLQFVVKGDEIMGYAPWDATLPVEMPFDASKDAGLVKASGVMMPISSGMFAVFAPRELHAPSLAADPAKPDIFKVVMKCRWGG